MPVRRRSGLWAVGIVGGAAIGAAILYGISNTRSSRPSSVGGSSITIGESSPPEVLQRALREGDPRALGVLQQRVAPVAGKPRTALSDTEAAQWLETLVQLRAGFLKFGPPARATSGMVASQILEKFAVEPAPAAWQGALDPTRDILTASLSDVDANVRFVALNQITPFWIWMPGRSLTTAEERALSDWKESLHGPVVRCLASKDVLTRIAAISCLGSLPIDAAAAPAVAYIEDAQSVDVRRQTLVSFAQRPNLLTEDMLLKRLHDDDQSIRDSASVILRARGLTQEQVSLGGLLVSPRADQRASVIKLIKDRTDIDPTVWLLQLSHDADETVRLHAVAALASQPTRSIPVNRRIAEMARFDQSSRVREAAGKLIPSTQDATASLPPLPGSSILSPKAN